MSTYYIKDLEKLSGIKAHTIRMWEKRYGIVTPVRTKTNIRCYSASDLKKILSVSILNRNGYKISRISQMTDSELHEHVLELSRGSSSHESTIENLILASIDLDEERFERIFAHLINRLGFNDTLVEIIYPFFTKIGLLWLTGSVNPAQEHFVSNIVRQKLIVAIDGLTSTPNPNSKRFILFLPDGEWHELGLLFFQFILKSANQEVIYLGQSVPLSDVIKVAQIKKPDYLFTSITSSMPEKQLYEFLREVSSSFQKQTIFISGLQLRSLLTPLPSNIKKVLSASQFSQDIKKL